jgi:hypothetical protein
MTATPSDRPTIQQHAISATLLVVVPVGIVALWLRDRWARFKAGI